MDYRIEKKEEFRLLVYAKMFTEESGEKGIPAFWDEYYQNEVYKKAPGYLGICTQEKEGAGEFMYGIRCDADDVKEIPEGFQIINVPAYTWAIFKCVGPTPKAIQKRGKILAGNGFRGQIMNGSLIMILKTICRVIIPPVIM